MELHEALGNIDVIRRQLARSEKFHGYRALPTALGAVAAVAGAVVQAFWLAGADIALDAFLTLWVPLAAITGGYAAGDAWQRRRRDSSLAGALVRLACEQFVPCVVVGAALTATIARFAPELGWTLPGLWSIVFSLGLFASMPLLPAAMLAAAAWYLVAGCTCLALGAERAGLSPWTMVVTFGVGQSIVAAVLAMQPDDESVATASPHRFGSAGFQAEKEAGDDA
jgi:hypothetical protein